MLIILSWQPKGGAMAPPKYAPVVEPHYAWWTGDSSTCRPNGSIALSEINMLQIQSFFSGSNLNP